jgi:hypothetical protein
VLHSFPTRRSSDLPSSPKATGDSHTTIHLVSYLLGLFIATFILSISDHPSGNWQYCHLPPQLAVLPLASATSEVVADNAS